MGLHKPRRGEDRRSSTLSIVSKIPIVFASIMFAPKILASIPELADYYKKILPGSGSLPATLPW